MEHIYLINTFLGFLVVQVSDVLRRDKESASSPKKFNLIFFIKDTWQKILLSLVLSYGLTLIVHLNLNDVALFADENFYGNLIYVVIGGFPEYLLQKFKKKYGIAQPTQVNIKDETFNRK